jgi:adenosylcobyric acid synthase
MGPLHGPWAALSGLQVQAYQIRAGRTAATGDGITEALPGVAWQRGPVLGLYLHGLFENPAVLQALFGHQNRPLDEVFDRLAARVEAGFTRDTLLSLLR